MADADVRPAEPADADEIARIQLTTWRAAYAEILPDEVLSGLDARATAEQWRTIRDLLARHGALNAAIERAILHATRARQHLLAAFRPSAERDALVALTGYVLSRDR